jgi:hypothetical protein
MTSPPGRPYVNASTKVLVVSGHGDLGSSNVRFKHWYSEQLLSLNAGSILTGGGIVVFIDCPCVAHILNTVSSKVWGHRGKSVRPGSTLTFLHRARAQIKVSPFIGS